VVPLADAADMIGALTLDRLLRTLGAALRLPLPPLRAALDPRGALAQSGLLSVDRNGTYGFRLKIDVIDALPDEMSTKHASLLDVFVRHFVPAAKGSLTLADYPHLADDSRILIAYLREALTQQRTGVNVLIYGRPGTGKTEYARALMAHLGAELFEVGVEDDSGDPREGRKRFGAYRLAQALLGKVGGRVLLFDEVEDVFVERARRGREDDNGSGIKGWVNRVLESNRVPTLWITNQVECLDAAYRRRFDYVLRLDVPPRSVRRRMLDAYVEGLPVGSAWREEAANHPALAPALIERASKVASRLLASDEAICIEGAMARVINNTLDALGESPVATLPAVAGPEYRLDYLNADCSLDQLREGLRQAGEGRICLYGPPGTGKSAFGRHVAASLDRPLLVRRASDLLSPYIGMTERQMSRMFREAEQEGAVLLLDEADSFLQDRRGAQRSWEVTQVNEMLTQMESFRGVFIASTNLFGNLDAAALRRFDAKIKLDYLKPDQAWALFQSFLQLNGIEQQERSRSEVAQLTNLTPGDFAALQRRLRLMAAPTAEALARLLRDECALKSCGPRRAVGFA
jgi:SpoVK/Ycf46/Vps4 family AAA+-type ATPase